MAGIFDSLLSDEAALGIGLLAAGGPTTDPNATGFGQRLAQGTGYARAVKDAALRSKLLESQMMENASQAEYRKATTDIARQNYELDQKIFAPFIAAASGGATAPAGALPASTLPPPSGISSQGVAGTQSPGAVLPPAPAPRNLVAMAGKPGDVLSPGGYAGGSRADANAESIRMIQSELARPGNSQADIDGMQREIARLQQQGASAVPAASPGAVIAPPAAPAAAPAATAGPGGVLAGMSPDQVAMFQLRGKNIAEPWKIAKFGNTVAAGSYRDFGDGKGLQFVGDLAKGVLPDGSLSPQHIADQATLAGRIEAAKQAEANRYEAGPVTIDPATGEQRQPSKLQTYGPGSAGPAPLVGLSTAQTQQNAAAKKFTEGVAESDNKRLESLRDGATAGEQAIKTAQNLRRIAASGIYEGGGAQAKTAVASLVAGLTGVTPKGLPGSEEFNAEASSLVLGQIKALGANPSNADREFIMKTIPQITTSPQAREALLQYMERKGQSSIAHYEQADAYGRKNGGLGGFKFTDPTDKPAGSGWTPPPGVTIREKK